MKDRILQIMRKENMSQQEFAKAIEVSPASLSNIFNGRTNPTNNHVSAIHHHFPDININWLMFGEGSMYVSDGLSGQEQADTASGDSSSSPSSPVGEGLLFPDLSSKSGGESLPFSVEPMGKQKTIQGEPVAPVIQEVVKYIDKPQRKITEIRIFFDDGTYEVFGRN